MTHECLASQHWVWLATEVQPGLDARLALATALRAELEADFPAELAETRMWRLPVLGNGHGAKLRAALRTGIRILPGAEDCVARLVTAGRLALLRESIQEVQAMIEGATLETDADRSAEDTARRIHARHVDLSIAWEAHELTRDIVKTCKDRDHELYTSKIRTCIPPYYRGVLANIAHFNGQSPRQLVAETPTSRRAVAATQKNAPRQGFCNLTDHQLETRALQPLHNI